VLSSHFTATENVEDPAQILIGVTALGPDAEKVQVDWRDGTLAEYALIPATAVTPVEGLSQIDPAQLAVLMRYIVPFGGLLRGRLAAGAYGAAVLLVIAMDAGRVVAAGAATRWHSKQ
jgi:alcohol dehydrogenase